jgi:type II secretory pathway pseudopilin PulG
MKRSQSGITLIGLLFWAVVLCSLALVVMKVIPAVTEFQTIQKMVTNVAGAGTTVPEIRTAFDRAKAVEYNVDAINSSDLEITKENDKVVVKFAYDKQIELMDPVYLLIKFHGRSK